MLPRFNVFWHLPGSGKRSEKIKIVAGFSSAGKSTYIRRILEEDSSLGTSNTVYEYMFRNKQRTRLNAGDVFHFDLSAVMNQSAVNGGNSVYDHPLAKMCVQQWKITEIVMLIVEEKELRARIMNRRHVGIGYGNDLSRCQYPIREKLQILEMMPLHRRYNMWFQYFRLNRIPVQILHSRNDGYSIVNSKSEAIDIIRGRQISPRSPSLNH